ncbi:MAG: DUF6912 family protein [Nocardioidaceae bacterium]
MTRVYVPSTLTRLREVVVSGGVGPAPFVAHAVTDALVAAWPDGGDEEYEYAASSAAARTSIGLVGEDDAPRRVVLAVDVGSVGPVGSEDPTAVEIAEVVPFRNIAAVLVDDEAAGDDVAAAAQVWLQAERGDEEAAAVVERTLDHELGWYATQEIPDLLEM